MATVEVGTAKISLVGDSTNLDVSVQRSESLLKKLGAEAASAFDTSNSKAKNAALSLLRYVELTGKSADEMKLLRAQWAGVDTSILKGVADQMAAIRNQEAATKQVADELADSWSRMQARAKAAYKDLMSTQRAEQLEREAAKVKQLAEAEALLAIKAQHAAQGLEFINQKAEADRINRMRQAVDVFGASLDRLESREFGATNAARQFTKSIQEQENAARGAGRTFEKTANQMNQYGLTAKQQAAAMRQVPAQITDIFVSLQGGQNPLTVLLQQGGQLKDVFGGAVPAMRALASGVMGLVNPWTLLAGALGTVLIAYKQLEGQQDAFNRSIILTGQGTKLAVADLRGLATELDAVGGATANQAANALAQAVGTGKIAVDLLKLVSEAAITTQNATGKAISETVAEYAELGRDPVSAVLRLNESEKFLTAAIFEKIAAMQEAGDIEGAAALASETRAAAQIARSADIVASLGLISGGWHDVKRATAEAWDQAGNYFTDLDRDAKKAFGTLRSLWSSMTTGGVAGIMGLSAAIGGADTTGTAAAKPPQAQNPATSAELAALKAIRDGNKTREERQRLEEKQIITIKRLTAAQIDSDKDIIASRKAYEASLPKGPKAPSGRSLANATASYELEVIKNQEEAQRNAIQNSTRMLQAEYSARLVNTEEYYARQRQLLQEDAAAQERSILKQIEYLRQRNVSGKDSVDTNKKIADLEQRLAKVRADSATSAAILNVQEQALLDDRKDALEEYSYNLDRNVASIRQNVDAQILSIMYGEREAEKQRKLTDIYNKQTEALRKLLVERDRGNITAEEYRQRVELENGAARRSADEVIDGYRRMDEAQADWLNGMRSGINDWMDQTSNVAKQINAITQRALDGTVDSLVTLATTGKNTFKELLADLLKQLSAFFIKQAVLMFLKYFMGGPSDSGSGGPTIGPYQAKGGAWDNGVQQFAKGGSFTNTVVNKPTMFKHGGGFGEMGEAGPEAIMPLQRGPDGSLGVKMYGGESGNVYVTIQTNIAAGGTSGAQTGDPGAYKDFVEQMRTVATQQIERSMMPGGSLHRAGVIA